MFGYNEVKQEEVIKLKYFVKFSKIIYGIFYAMIALILIVGVILALITPEHMQIDIPGRKYFGMFIVLVLFLTLLTLVVHVIIAIKGLSEFFKVKSIIKRAFIGAFLGVGISLVVSFIKQEELFSGRTLISILVFSFLSLGLEGIMVCRQGKGE